MNQAGRLTKLATATLFTVMLSANAASATANAATSSEPTTTAASTSAQQGHCGYHHHGPSEDWYGHCTTDGSVVQVRVVYDFAPDRTRCFGPGDWYLGTNASNAYYTGRLC